MNKIHNWSSLFDPVELVNNQQSHDFTRSHLQEVLSDLSIRHTDTDTDTDTDTQYNLTGGGFFSALGNLFKSTKSLKPTKSSSSILSSSPTKISTTKPTNSTNPTKPIDPSKPTNSTNPTKPIDPSKSTNPSNPINPRPTDPNPTNPSSTNPRPTDPRSTDLLTGANNSKQSFTENIKSKLSNLSKLLSDVTAKSSPMLGQESEEEFVSIFDSKSKQSSDRTTKLPSQTVGYDTDEELEGIISKYKSKLQPNKSAQITQTAQTTQSTQSAQTTQTTQSTQSTQSDSRYRLVPILINDSTYNSMLNPGYSQINLK
jgi:hypothetical protein